MSNRLGRVLAAAIAALRAGLGTLLALGLLGALAGLGWGLAEQPEYRSAATVLVVDRGDPVELVGSGAVGNSSSAGAGRLLELVRSEDVAELAAASLGGDLSGADLVATTEFRAAAGGRGIVVRSTAPFPDFAAAAANAFAGSVIEVATVFERRRLRKTIDRLQQKLDELDPASDQALALGERLEAAVSLEALGPPLRAGREGEIPLEPESRRSTALTTLAGAALGLLLAAALLLAREARRRPLRRSEQLERLLGAPVNDFGPTARIPAAGGPARIEVDDLGRDRMQGVVSELGLAAGGEARTLAVVSPMPGEGRTTLVLGVAAALATRGVNVLVVEGDMRAPTIGDRLRLDDGPGLADYLRGEAGPREVIHTVAVTGADAAGEGPGFVCVTAGGGLGNSTELLASARFVGLVDQLRRVYDVVLFDTAPMLASADAEIVSAQLDGALVCARAGMTSAGQIEASRERLPGSSVLGGVLLGAPHRARSLRRLPRLGKRLARTRG